MDKPPKQEIITKYSSIHEKVLEKIRAEKLRPKPDDFYGVGDITDSEISKDINDVVGVRNHWKKDKDTTLIEAKQKSDLMEFAIYKNMSGWINNKAKILLPSLADDYLRGIDLIIEHEAEKKDTTESDWEVDYLGIGIDVALASNENTSHAVINKIVTMKERLQKGELTEARYVQGNHFKGRIADLPYVILAITSEHLNDFIPNLTKNEQTLEQKDHITKYISFYQVAVQLNTYFHYLSYLSNNEQDEDKKDKYTHAAHQYGLANNTLYEIAGDVISQVDIEINPEVYQQVMSDPGTVTIERYCDELLGEIK